MVGIERNKDPDLTPKERNTSYFVILDDRKHGRSGKFPVFYDVDTGDYLEPPEGFLESDYQTLKEWYNARGMAGDVTKEDVYGPAVATTAPATNNGKDAEQEEVQTSSVLSYDPSDSTEEMNQGGVFTDPDEEEAPF